MGLVSTWMGDRLGIPDAVGILLQKGFHSLLSKHLKQYCGSMKYPLHKRAQAHVQHRMAVGEKLWVDT